MQNLKEKAGLYFEKNALRYKEDYYLRSKIHPKWIRHQIILQLVEEFIPLRDSLILDVGCGKGYLLHEMKLLLPDLTISGFDISNHGIATAKQEVKEQLFIHRAQDSFPFQKDEFDLAISLGCLHNLRIFELEIALKEMERVASNGYLMLESYRNEQEQFNLQCWALTCESFFDTKEWTWLFEHLGYKGDYEFIYFI